MLQEYVRILMQKTSTTIPARLYKDIQGCNDRDLHIKSSRAPQVYITMLLPETVKNTQARDYKDMPRYFDNRY